MREPSLFCRLFTYLYRYWRVFATGLSFAVFGLGGPVVAALCALIFLLFPMRQGKRVRVSRAILRSTYTLYVNFMRALGLLSFEVKQIERLEKQPCIIIANHPSLLDVVFLFSLVPNASCIVKRALFHNVFTRLPIRAAGYLANDDSELIKHARQVLEAGAPLIIFPEGTRSTPGQPLRFQRGVAHIALQLSCPILPVIARCDPPTLLKGQQWYQVPDRKPHFSMEFGELLDPSQFVDDQAMPSTQARQLTRGLQQWYEQRL
ncbi:lysophospholipid acyltransferase family protein [Agaribacterium sp. ZY112]|uniref:lysophospholipid acyltransferase family protein n=1 Tax=Agaribacterium sp. ZY112 TaxID=3233574 RepID=UPI00352641A9